MLHFWLSSTYIFKETASSYSRLRDPRSIHIPDDFIIITCSGFISHLVASGYFKSVNVYSVTPFFF